MKDAAGSTYPDELTFKQALNFLQNRGNAFYDGIEANKRFGKCKTHKRIHPYGFWNIIIGNYVGLDTEQEVIDWAKALIPNSI